MMPSQAYLTRIGMKGAEGMTKESEAWAEDLEALVESHLKTDGIAINSATNPLSSGASDAEISGVISQVQEKLHSVAPLMYKKPGRIAKSAYTLGDQVGMLPCSEKSDILVFVQGMGQGQDVLPLQGRDEGAVQAIDDFMGDLVAHMLQVLHPPAHVRPLLRPFPGHEFLLEQPGSLEQVAYGPFQQIEKDHFPGLEPSDQRIQ